MVTACRKAGVKVYVDAVINHTTGQGSTSYGGKTYTPYTYPTRAYMPSDFHYNVGACPQPTAASQDFNNKPQVCELQPGRARGPADRDAVRAADTLAGYLNKLIGYGVVGLPGRRGQAHRSGRPRRDLRQLEQDQGRTSRYWALEVFPAARAC